MRTVGLPKGDVAAPPLGELLLGEVLAPVTDTLLNVPPLLVVDAELLVVPAAPLPPNTAVPVSSNRLCGGVGTVSAATLAFAVDVELADVVAGAHDAAVPVAWVVLPTLAVPVLVLAVPMPAPLVVLPVPVFVVREPVPLALLVPASAAATVPVELEPVLTVAVPADVAPLPA